MKKKFTKLTAALALLALFILPLTGWGQTKATEPGTFIIDFYDANNLTATQGTGLTNNNYSQFVQVPTGITATNVVTSVNVTGTVQYAKNGGLTAGTGTAAGPDTHYVTFNIGNDYAVTKCTVYATAYESGRWLLNSDPADSGTLGTKGATIETVTDPYIWDNLNNVTALTFKKDNGSGGNQKRLTIYRIVCEYSTGSTPPQPATYTITYKAGEGSGNDVTETKTQGVDYTILGKPAGFTAPASKPNFNGWLGDDSNTYAAGDTYSTDAALTLTAQWATNGGGNSNLVTDELTNSNTINEVTTNYKSWTTTGTSGAEYSGQSAGGDGTIQLRTNNSNSGIVSTTSAGKVKKVTVTWANVTGNTTGKTLDIYGKNTAYTAPTDLYNNTNKGTKLGNIVYGTSTELTISGDYAYIGLRSNSGAMYFDEIDITWEPDNTPAITFDPASIALGNVPVNQQIQQTFTVAQSNLTDNISLTASVGNLSVSSINQGAQATEVTWTYTPPTAGAINATITATSGTLQETLAITGTAKGPHSVTISTSSNGTVEASTTSAIEGATITLTATPDAYYYLHVISATGATSSTTLGLTIHTNGTLSFTMPDEDVTVGATFNGIQPMTVTNALGATLPLGHYVCVEGTVSSFYGSYTSITGDNSHRYYISDGTNELLVYNGTGLNHAAFESDSDLQVGDEVVVWGELVDYTYNSTTTRELGKGNYIVSKTAANYIINFYVNGQVDNSLQKSIEKTAGAVLGTLPTTAANTPAGFELYGWMVKPTNAYYNATDAPTAMVDASTTVTSDMDLAAVFRIATTDGGWTLSNTAPVKDDKVILAVNDNGTYYAMYNKGNKHEVVVASNMITDSDAESYAWDVVEATYSQNSGLALTNSSGKFHMNNSSFNVTSDYNNGIFEFTSSGTGYIMHGLVNNKYLKYANNQFGISSDATDACVLCVFKFNAGTTTYSDYTTLVNTLAISKYTTDANGWHLIASPVSTTPDKVINMIPTSAGQGYDLYRFNQSGTDGEWENYRNQNHQTGFNIVPGKGYLYANSTNVTLGFYGEAYTGNGSVGLIYDDNAPKASLKGVNLIGNPYNATATVDKDFYVMNDACTEIVAAANDRKVNPMEGIFVVATAPGQSVAFAQATQSTGPNNSSNAVVMNLTQNRGNVVDRAIVRFGNSSNLPKFQLFDNSAKLYMAQDGKDYAIVSAEAQGEMPVNFKAAVDGTYTISVATEGIEANYLHLIDNLTGMDVDLLQTPSYTFNARQNDYASRFRLVFSANSANENNSDSFAFISNGQIILTNVDNDATIQVIDALGRMIVNTNTNNHVYTDNMAPGVYVLRLVNGNDVKTQKIVVK